MPRLSKIGAACLAAFGFGSGGITPVTATYLVVAGGGGAARGGGGAGGLQTGTVSLNPTLSYTVIVGAGGAAGGSYAGVNGSNSSLSALGTASVGGGGGGNNSVGGNGGSGGGGAYQVGGSPAAGGTATSGQGYAGGASGAYSGNYYTGGGGGAGAAGTAGGPGNGGVGVSNSITGTAVYYAGGGGGTGDTGTPGTGGNGGGGAGALTSGVGTSGTANLGGGGGAGNTGSNGGSGVVIVKYTGVQQFGGGIVSYDGTNTIHTFKTSGQLVPLNSLTASYLIVAGGGGGGGGGNGGGGGGGAGGLLTGSGMVIDTSSTYLVTVGAGGTGGSSSSSYLGTQGGSSSFSIVSTTAVGGGYGAGTNTSGVGVVGGNGGSGGGAAHWDFNGTRAGGTATSSQGNAGGSITATGGGGFGGGGGGAGAAGTNTTSGAQSGTGGVGVASSISGTSIYYAGGGGSGYQGGGAAGGNGGGGTGTYNSNASAGTAGTGGGGGGNTSTGSNTGGNGGGGAVIISYAGSTQLMAGGTVTIVGGYVIHTFTSSGYLTPLTFIGNSLRFRSSASANLSRTPTVTSDRQKWTWSGWVKRGLLGGSNPYQLFGARVGGGVSYALFYFNNTDTLKFIDGDTTTTLETNAVFRDPSAWYHVVCAVDTTQATAANRIKFYVNGTQITSFSTATYPAQNANMYINTANIHYIGQQNTSQYFDGYMADIRFIDGQQLTPVSFGTFNSYGVWQPINYGGSYGTNGFYLPFNSGTSSYVGSFNGSNHYLSLPSGSMDFMHQGAVSWTFECFFNSNTQTVAGHTLLSTDASSASIGMGISINTYNQADIDVEFFRGSSGNYYKIVTAGLNFKPSMWNHIAVTYNSSGSVVRIFINGIEQATTTTGTATFSSSTATYAPNIGRYQAATPGGYFNGSIANLRVVSGSILYTGNFTPPTLDLTAVNGTQLLTLKGASITDTSTNAYTITNNNSVTTGVTYPFAIGILNDQSPQGNHWSNGGGNISGFAGPTLDYMKDSPTLTSATAANFCVINPLSFVGGWTASNGNLTVSTSSVTNQFGSLGSTTGKFYFEFTPTTSADSWIGVANLATNGGISLYRNDGTRYAGGSYVAYGATYTNGDTIGCAFDIDNGTIQFFKNGTSQGTVSSIPYNGGIIGPILLSGVSGGYNVNFGQQPFKYTPPTNFVALNTYNM